MNESLKNYENALIKDIWKLVKRVGLIMMIQGSFEMILA